MSHGPENHYQFYLEFVRMSLTLSARKLTQMSMSHPTVLIVINGLLWQRKTGMYTLFTILYYSTQSPFGIPKSFPSSTYMQNNMQRDLFIQDWIYLLAMIIVYWQKNQEITLPSTLLCKGTPPSQPLNSMTTLRSYPSLFTSDT